MEQDRLLKLRAEIGDAENEIESIDQILGKQTLGSLNPGPHGPFFSTNWEKNLVLLWLLYAIYGVSAPDCV